MKYDVYRHKDATDEQFVYMDKFFKQVEEEDKQLCNGAQVNLNVGTYSAGQLQPSEESAVLYHQNLVREAVTKHRQKEERLKEEIWPARLETVAGKNGDVEFCQKLEACTAMKASEW